MHHAVSAYGVLRLYKRVLNSPSSALVFKLGGTVHTDLEHFVDADEIAALLGESRRNVIRMVREGKLTAYLMTGIQRHTYKFRRSEVIRDIEKFRQPYRHHANGK